MSARPEIEVCWTEKSVSAVVDRQVASKLAHFALILSAKNITKIFNLKVWVMKYKVNFILSEIKIKFKPKISDHLHDLLNYFVSALSDDLKANLPTSKWLNQNRCDSMNIFWI